jgi:hypothetical protein
MKRPAIDPQIVDFEAASEPPAIILRGDSASQTVELTIALVDAHVHQGDGHPVTITTSTPTSARQLLEALASLSKIAKAVKAS